MLGGAGCTAERYELTLATQELVTFGCLPWSREAGPPSYELVEQRRGVLGEADARAVAAELEKLAEVPMPTLCSYDGRAFGLTVERGATTTSYLDDDYNCHHDTAVKYTSSLSPLTALLRAAR